jgi:archaellum biogenesis protein FlaJ (TadC family)
MSLWLKISVAVFLGYMIIRLWPAAMHQIKHGPKGSSDDWRAAIFPILLVIGFVVFLIMMVKG